MLIKDKSRHVNSHAFKIPFAQTDYYKNSFFPRTIRDWNALPTEAVEAPSLNYGLIFDCFSIVFSIVVVLFFFSLFFFVFSCYDR